MAFPENESLPGNRCEICGAELSDEVVLQEFADGSIARLCTECAAGATLDPAESDAFEFPEIEEREPSDVDSVSVSDTSASFDTSSSFDDSSSFEDLDAQAGALGDEDASADGPDPLEKTRELLTPVVDLISLQSEMQEALQRLAASLETFATGVISENLDKTATVESRLETLELELEQTRSRLRETEALLAASGIAMPVEAGGVGGAEDAAGTGAAAAGAAVAGAALAGAAASSDAEQVLGAPAATPPEHIPEPVPVADVAATAGAAAVGAGDVGAPTGAAAAGAAAIVAGAQTGRPSDSATQPYTLEDLAAQQTPPPTPPPVAPPPVAPPAGPATAEHHARPGFQLPEVQLAQRYFNESQFTNRVRDVRKSLGKPKANLTKLIGAEPRAILTIAWDIIWYQYLIDLRRDIPSEERVTLHREGMDLDELTSMFKEKNASVDDDGRLDASELEVKLLSDPSTLITEMSVEDERALEDATEEIWDQKTAPEFKWDD